MMVKARAGHGGPALARYLMDGKNEHAELLELRNMDAPSFKAALFDMDMLARGSQCHAHALHVQMRAAPGERLSASHWREACDRYAEAFGMEQHQAAVILHHQPDGATHAHFVFNRVHPVTLKAADLWRNYAKHKTLAREMEKDWGLRQVSSQKRDRSRDYSNAGQQETEQALHQVHPRTWLGQETAAHGHQQQQRYADAQAHYKQHQAAFNRIAALRDIQQGTRQRRGHAGAYQQAREGPQNACTQQAAAFTATAGVLEAVAQGGR